MIGEIQTLHHVGLTANPARISANQELYDGNQYLA
jgi:hypothetical protein